MKTIQNRIWEQTTEYKFKQIKKELFELDCLIRTKAIEERIEKLEKAKNKSHVDIYKIMSEIYPVRSGNWWDRERNLTMLSDNNPEKENWKEERERLAERYEVLREMIKEENKGGKQLKSERIENLLKNRKFIINLEDWVNYLNSPIQKPWGGTPIIKIIGDGPFRYLLKELGMIEEKWDEETDTSNFEITNENNIDLKIEIKPNEYRLKSSLYQLDMLKMNKDTLLKNKIKNELFQSTIRINGIKISGMTDSWESVRVGGSSVRNKSFLRRVLAEGRREI